MPKTDVEATKYSNIHPELLPLDQLKNTNRKKLMAIYEALKAENVREQLDADYIDRLVHQTVELNYCLLPEDYTLVLQTIRKIKELPHGCISSINEGIRRITPNFNKKQIAIILRAYVALSSRSISTITELIKTFNKNIEDAELWQLRDVSSALASLRVQPAGDIDTFYNSTVALLQKHLKTLHADDIGVFLNAFSRQKVKHDEILHFVDLHANRIISEASYRNLALIANAFAKAEKHSTELIKAITGRMYVELEEFTPRNNEHGSIAVVDETTETSQPTKVPLNVIDVAITFNSLTKMDAYPDRLLNAYIPWLKHHINSETPTLSLVLLAHAYAQVGIQNEELFTKVAHFVIRRINNMNCQQLGVIALSFAKSGHKIPILFLRIADEVIYRGTVALKYERYEFDLQSLEHLLQAFSRINFKDQRFYAVMTTLLKRRLKISTEDELHGETIASMLTSMSRNNVNDFIPLITDAIVKRQGSTAYSTQALCRVVSAFSRMNIKHSKIIEYMLKQTKDRVNEFQIPLLINTLKALAKLKCYDLHLIKESLKRFSLYLAHLTTQDIANLLSALNDFGFRNVSFLQKIIMCIKHRMTEFKPSQLHLVFTRLATLRTSDADLYKELTKRLLDKKEHFNEVQLADICVGYIYVLVHFDYLQRVLKSQRSSETGCTKTQVDHQLADEHVGDIMNVDPTKGVFIDRSAEGVFPSGTPYSSMENLFPYGFNDSILDTMLSQLGTKLDVATIFKVQTVQYYLQYVRCDIYGSLSKKAMEVLHQCSAVKFSLAEYMLTSSSVHRELSHMLNLMGVCHMNEVQFGPYLIDIVPETGSNLKVAIEYDGPTHFYAETIMRTAKSILKHEILENAGWQVLHVAYQEWAQLVSPKQKLVYLNNLRQQYERELRIPTIPQVEPIQKRCFSSALNRKRRYLERINDEILKQHLEMPPEDGEDCNLVVEAESVSSTDKIEEEVCSKLMGGNKSILDLDNQGEEDPCLTKYDTDSK